MEVSLGRTTLALVSGSQRQQPREQVPGPLRDTRAARRGLWKPPLPAQGWQSPSGPLPVDKVSELGLGPTSPRVQWNPGPGMPTAHLLILGPPVQMGFSVHVQQQQVTEEGDLGEAGRPVSWPSACPPAQDSKSDTGVECTLRHTSATANRSPCWPDSPRPARLLLCPG